MAKAPKTKRKTGGDAAKSAGGGAKNASGKHLVIVESPAKAKTINKYLGSDYVVMASVGHVRDLPSRNPKGVKNPVPGVDLENNFEPTYEILADKKKTIAELRKVAKSAADIWFATDLDREGEAIAWHLAQALNVDLSTAKRVVFNAITKTEITNAFSHPRPINGDRVNAQQARRILDRIVGYQVSPLLWKKVAGGLSAGRVQSVAVRIVVDREREIQAFMPEEFWKITGYFTADLANTAKFRDAWRKWIAEGEAKAAAERAKGKPATANGRTIRERNGWLSEHKSLSAELVEVDGTRFEPKAVDEVIRVAQAAGLIIDKKQVTDDPKGKGPAARRINLIGRIGVEREWRIKSTATKRTRSRPYPPFITSTLQQAASNVLGYTTNSTMRLAQQLYEGVDLQGMGSVGLITYMRTDSTHISNEALAMARKFIETKYGPKYLPEKANLYKSSNKAAQEAHEAIRPTDVNLSPDSPSIRNSLNDQQLKLYRMIWQRFVACQMTPAEWDSTAVLIETKVTGDRGQGTRSDQSPPTPVGGTDPQTITFKATGRMLVFDGFYKVIGVPQVSDELTLPKLEEKQQLGALEIDPSQHFTSPPPRYSEASLVKKLEAEGIGRPSTYASIINVIQNRKYVEKVSNRFFATDLGMVVTDKLVEAFPRILDVGYTRKMESELDAIEEKNRDWIKMLQEFYDPFKTSLASAYESMEHAKAAQEPAPKEYACPTCNAPTVYRFGKNGRFLSCSRYPDCKYAAPVDREGKPQGAQMTDILCPICGKGMTRRVGRFGAFLGCEDYPTCKGIVNLDPKKGIVKLPKAPPLLTDLPCPKCESPLNMRRSKRGPWLSCSRFPKCRGRLAWSAVEEPKQKELEDLLAAHEAAHPMPPVKTTEGKVIGEDDAYVPKIQGGEEPAESSAEEVAVDADAA
ncbi:MAG: type I DNA topoisomerase [Phycisphaeraceae bacterium]